MGAILVYADQEGARLFASNLNGSLLSWACLEGAYLVYARLEANISAVRLGGADLREAFFSADSRLNGLILMTDTGVPARVVDAHWGDANLAVVEWSSMPMPGEEYAARHWVPPEWAKTRPDRWAARLEAFEAAVRANRQLATVLQNQGLNDRADQFAYRAQKLRRIVNRRQALLVHKEWHPHWWQRARWLGAWARSWLLDLIAGYGYRHLRSFLAYAAVIVGFMGLYLLNSQFVMPHLSWNEALVLSVSSFHGRGFFNSRISLGDTYAELAAVEAFFGLLIEITFIATFTNRFFAR